MKIEIGESLFRSWLRHVKCCQVAELNWKPSSSWITDSAEDISDRMREAAQYFEKGLQIQVFGKTTTAKQLVRQAEIDVLGVRYRDGGIDGLYGVDVAFHREGLNYGPIKETLKRVLKKMIRTGIVVEKFFPGTSGKIIFASPLIRESYLNPLLEGFSELNSFAQGHGWTHRFQILHNSEFEKEVMRPLLEISDDVDDTSELFLRSHQMLELFPTRVAAHVAEVRQNVGNLHSAVAQQPLPIELEPSDQDAFLAIFLKSKRAEITTVFDDGRKSVEPWGAERFSANSNLMRNLRSRPKFRQGEWQRQGIKKVIVKAIG